MQLSGSKSLLKSREKLRTLIELLRKDYAYVSILATDCGGSQYVYSRRNKMISPYGFGERGFVLRAYRNEGYMEYSFNEIDDVETLSKEIKEAFENQEKVLNEAGVEKYETPLVYEEKVQGEFYNVNYPSVHDLSKQEIMDRLKEISDKGLSYPNIVECQARYTFININKMFLSDKKDLIQSYAYSLASLMMLGFKDGETNYNGTSASGFAGVELLDEITPKMDSVYNDLMAMFGAGNIEPGIYDVVVTPEAAGLIAHEAFGHGLEMDMFVKNRACAKEHMGDKLGSDVCCMYDGTTEVNDSATYVFDDEGTISGLTTILENGILKNGMTDLLSSLRLGVKASGNGRRENFERKAYTRMTNTYFGGGNSTVEEMIASIDYGFLVDGSQNGMEDPKHWGIQCVLARAWEIKDGKLTGKLFTPVYLTGYVPDLLSNISMVSSPVSTNGNGYCGKGYKEWVVVSDGGPYLKTKVRLG